MNTFQETLRKKVFYVVGVLAVILLAIMGSQIVFLHMATVAGEADMASQMRAQFVQEVIGTWDFAALFLALFLGASGISSEIAAKTIVNVLSRPVERSVYIAGRSLGIVAFLWAFHLVGFLSALGVAGIFDIHFAPTFWVAGVEMFEKDFLLAGVSLGLSVVMPSVLAGSSAFLISIASALTESGLKHPQLIVRLLANLVYYAAPARMPVDLLAASFSKEMLHPDYGIYFQVLGENLLYAVAVLVVMAAVFRKRELRLR